MDIRAEGHAWRCQWYVDEHPGTLVSNGNKKEQMHAQRHEAHPQICACTLHSNTMKLLLGTDGAQVLMWKKIQTDPAVERQPSSCRRGIWCYMTGL